MSAIRGFTLIEFVIVLVIMGVFIAFVGPRVAGGLMGMDIREAALKTAAMLRYARSKSVNTGCRYHVIFDAAGRRVVLLQAAFEDDFGSSDRVMVPDADQGDFDDRVPGEQFGGEGSRSVELEKKIYAFPGSVLFENMTIADIDSGNLGEDAIMMLTFYPNGTNQGAVLTISDKRGRQYFITVAPVSGSVRVDEEDDDD